MNRTWTDAEIQFLRDHYLVLNDPKLAEHLSKTRGSVKSKRKRLGLIRPKEVVRRMQKEVMADWTDEEYAFLKKNNNFMTNREIGRSLGRSKSSISNQMCKLGLTRRDEVRDKMKKSTQFKKGMIPWNKGIKGLRFSPETEFKPGHVPASTKYDGCVTWRNHIRGYGYYYVRIAKREWVLWHRYLWEKVFGPIPKGHIVIFRDGNSRNVFLENLESISRAENARRNHNAEKMKISMKKAWEQGLHLESDKYIAYMLAPVDAELRERVMQVPELIELKRQQLKLKRAINEIDE